LEFALEPDSIEVAAEATGGVALTVRAKDVLDPNAQRRTHWFVITGKVEGARAQPIAEGTFVQEPSGQARKLLLSALGLAGRTVKAALLLALMAFFVLLLLTVLDEGARGNARLQGQVAPILAHPASRWLLELPVADLARGLVRFLYQWIH
jgi:hypothetical protein